MTGDVKEHKKKPKKRDGIFRVYKLFLTYVAIAVVIQTAIQLLLISGIQYKDEFWQNIIYNIVNIGVLLALVAAFGYMYYKKSKAVTEAIDMLAEGREVNIPEKGVTSDLAESINLTSDILKRQREIIERRDNARSEWIRGVSHDIRTPLSIVMGYAEVLADDDQLSEGNRKYAETIKEQSIKIRDLVEDLNLAMKLEYNKQPLRLSDFSPAALLRESVGGIMDTYENSDRFDVELIILPEFEKLKLTADRMLIKRVLDNILGNALRHNAAGCSVLCFAYKSADMAIVEITDDGKGIPEDIASAINSFQSELGRGFKTGRESDTEAEARAIGELYENEDEERLAGKHIMGLRIAKQIMLAHGGNLIIKPDRHTVQLILV